MLPDNELSSIPQIAAMLFPKNLPIIGIESYELGGIALNDPSQGLQVRGWRGYADEFGNVWIGPIEGPFSIFQTFPGITELSLTFDQNMNPFLAYVQAGIAKFYWFDTLTSSYENTTLPVGSISPRASLDDKRNFAIGTSDIILAYIDDGNLIMRMQRDRYEIEYILYPDINIPVVSPSVHDVGMGVNNRFQFIIYGEFFPV